MEDLKTRARAIRLLCTDVDGVLTTGELHYGGGEAHTKVFHVRDGAGIVWLRQAGLYIAFISGLRSPSTEHRARDLGVHECWAGHLAKGPVLDELCAKYGLGPEQVAHVGDDLADLPLLTRVGLACCPSDAVEEVRRAVHWVVPTPGGHGVLRQVAELILKAQGRWDSVLDNYNNRQEPL